VIGSRPRPAHTHPPFGTGVGGARGARRVVPVATPGAPPFELQAGRGLRFDVKGQPGITAEFELDETGAVVRLVAQPLGIFRPKT
jgi:hypothetical protein